MTIEERARSSRRTQPARAHTVDPSAAAPAQPRFASPAARVHRWQRAFATLLATTDTIVVATAVLCAQFLRFGVSGSDVSWGTSLGVDIAYIVVSVIIIVGWLLSLRLVGSRDYRTIGSGTDEYKRLTNATFGFFGFFAIMAFLLKAQIGRGYLLMSLPLGWVLLMLSRWLWRKWLISRRVRGRLMSHAVLVGDRVSARHVAKQIQSTPSAGIKIIGAITERGTTSRSLTDTIPVLGEWDRLLDHVDRVRADTVIVTGNHSLTPRQLRELGWGLETRKATLIVAPALTDVAGPRLHSRPVAGLPLIHVDYPELTGGKRMLKRATDIVASGLGLILLSPVFLVIGICVQMSSPGPAFFRQERVGLRGRPFRMLKFRSMVADAEKQLSSLLDASEGNGVLFKMKNDPRITPLGRFLRRYSLDELPQLWNVLKGEMSLVGPRPPLASEVHTYDQWVHRRLLVKPGITGLWQVSGRSNLSWDDSVRLDLYYVENWSMTTDLIVLWRTARAVLGKDGAY
ncbi:sugar transferase [Microbacterium terrisoli]|uniref:sugar transferase n=1 Tax=Microbacterium terrisoli TaxID=3242192 RepID=UPI002805235D|nr:sugar transferase [Microbacterium protaetiae]